VSYARKPFQVPRFHNGALLSRTSAGADRLVIGDPVRAAHPVKASKAARELAKKRGIDLTGLRGTGDNGSVTVDDVRRLNGGI
jgi:pyruvate/2-oxoglutarate dehydrogenase complex dihydrolipoamide acyltransferase (E2) component